MLTNIFYYNFYRPYMIKNATEVSSSTPVKRKSSSASTKGNRENASFQLNKALKTDVIHYAKEMTKTIVGLKDSAKNIVRDMDELDENIFEKDFDTAKGWIEEDLQEFTDGINQALDFSERQQHSPIIKGFSQEISDTLSEMAEDLSKLGLRLDQNGRLSFQREEFEKLGYGPKNNSLADAVTSNVDTIRKVYDQTTDILSIPMSEHMNFKNLNYYYNYRLGNIYNDTFKIIESGMIVDAVI